MMRTDWPNRWLTAVLLLAAAAYAVAEEMTLTTIISHVGQGFAGSFVSSGRRNVDRAKHVEPEAFLSVPG